MATRARARLVKRKRPLLPRAKAARQARVTLVENLAAQAKRPAAQALQLSAALRARRRQRLAAKAALSQQGHKRARAVQAQVQPARSQLVAAESRTQALAVLQLVAAELVARQP
ncbi:MAG: hypothetical protein RL701_7171 [Pseudomonadota bacterium]